MQVFSKDLKAAAEVSSTQSFVSQYDIGDLVTISPSEVGVVVKVEKDMITALNQYGILMKLTPQQIRGRRDSSRAVTSDKDGRPLTCADSVTVLDSLVGGVKKQARVLHVYRSFVFLQSRETPENSGIFVMSNSAVSVVNARSNRPGLAPGFVTAAPRSFNGRTSGIRDPLVAKTVTITTGVWKGYLGIVKEMTETIARVELHTNNRIVSVSREALNVQDGSGFKNMSNQSGFGDRYGSYGGGRTPAEHGSKTPMYSGGAMSGGRTPAWDAGSKTPAYDSGNRTPAWDSGSKTPGAWDSNSRTPARDYGTPHMPFQNELYMYVDLGLLIHQEVICTPLRLDIWMMRQLLITRIILLQDFPQRRQHRACPFLLRMDIQIWEVSPMAVFKLQWTLQLLGQCIFQRRIFLCLVTV